MPVSCFLLQKKVRVIAGHLMGTQFTSVNINCSPLESTIITRVFKMEFKTIILTNRSFSPYKSFRQFHITLAPLLP